ncbi:hypothetical protein PQR14_03215 [Paraburkholderia bryophila]|uniref:hypothetical protein n=1 Tax=Burkholderiaceae TaxID=119060 RepID=UPI0015904870|nr:MULTISPECIES: hypothetical protein [Burkholderiaceae]
MNRTTKRREALRQQRRDFVRANGNEGARGDRVVTSNGTAGQDREDGQEAAERKAAVAAVGDGAVSARTTRLTSIPSHQRASDSHDYTRLATLKVLNGLLEIRTRRLKKQDAGMIFSYRCEPGSLRRKHPFGFCDVGMKIACEPAYTSQ